MREATPAQIEAALLAPLPAPNDSQDAHSRRCIAIQWRAMIDALIEQQGLNVQASSRDHPEDAE